MLRRAYGTVPDPLLLPVDRDGQLVSGLRSGALSLGLRAAVRCRPDAWGRVSFLAIPLPSVGWTYDSDYSLTTRMYMDVPHFDDLLAPPLTTFEGLEDFILKPKKLDGEVAINVDVILG